eukprot:CAMPEP_0182441614 /NCGR_PEP_ID=MMETSP1172-20130603/594_1 /TAXON_ID=708627 /ORGANISM="Timspurckia oligopyrenoides, Strain CCMP3278" /LENGTH=41 /DNA_ID= /DNA_START= /DNA_END= /DNA_ORIENTATION=
MSHFMEQAKAAATSAQEKVAEYMKPQEEKEKKTEATDAIKE